MRKGNVKLEKKVFVVGRPEERRSIHVEFVKFTRTCPDKSWLEFRDVICYPKHIRRYD